MSNKAIVILLTLVFGVVALLLWKRHRNPSPAVQEERWWAIKGATLYTMDRDKPTSQDTILVRGDKIFDIGPNLDLPKKTHIISGVGKLVTPGIVMANTRLGVMDISLESSTHSGNFHSTNVERPGFQVRLGFDFNSSLIPVTRIEGVTSALIQPYGGTISGQSALVNLYGSPERMLIRPTVAVHAAIHVGQSSSTWRRLHELMEQSRFFEMYRAQYDRRQNRPLQFSRIDLEAMTRVIRGEMPLVLSVNRAADILLALRFAQEQRIRIVLSGVAEGWQVAKQIAKANVPVLLGAPYNLPSQFDRLGSRYDNAALLYRAGVLFAFSAEGDAHNVRAMRYEAGIAVAWGLPEQAALLALTHNFYRIFGLHQQYGSLKRGYKANIVMWNGDPLELSTRALQVWVCGNPVPMISRQTLLRDRYKNLNTLFHKPWK